jgi:uncharacterized surface protein with fasciclin (FAS1) repeats
MKNSILSKTLKGALILAFTFSATAVMAQVPTEAATMPAPEESVVDVINASPDHTILASLLVETRLDETLSQAGAFTVVAPTDAAFAELGDAFESLKDNPQQLQQIVLNHLFQGAATATEVEEAFGLEISATIDSPDNGVVHVTDEVILQRQ